MTTNPPVLLLDACILYPAGLRNLMMWLAVHDLIRPKWSDRIHGEWMRNVLNDRPDLTRDQLERTRRLMDQHAGDCLVTGYARHVARLELPDEDDRHVLAAAIESEAEAIVTWNVSDFPEDAVLEFGIGVLTPDELVQSLLVEDTQATIRAMAEHRGSLANPPLSPSEYVGMLARQGLRRTVEQLGDMLGSL